ncbi:hypothetical protein H0920_00335 [Acinetobacter sp. C_4_1]|uniref:hypothetical protein n=1 Tax=unclassified Acinetobacter TaxID=196816 RepID=UPI0021B7D75D|nr:MULTISPECIES: hypothetical protein [unclassified Acinetobacter]MCT8088547.1 hypothetical protein [Acinetobacter sp. F_3_1]MCT8096703.1 hypothetical protein [Acinetobacter sp. C_3_1]MCT8099578.1 hypothetical protein [Acinetobacter sp. C_4_1]MCT8133546.1 hypothetical protein [Acinetobacter sp. T_3_1]
MKNTKITIYMLVPLLISITTPSLASELEQEQAPSERAAGTEFFFSDDSEGFQTRKLSAEFLPRYEDADHYLGVRGSAYQYRADEWQRDGQKISFIGRHIESATANGWAVEAGVFNQGDHTLFTFDGSYRTALAEKTALELFANRDWVETQAALDAGTNFTFVGAALDQGIGEHVTLVGVAGTQFFSDDNRRDHGRLRLIYQPSLDLGLTLQARYRTYRSTEEDVGRQYFNPQDYEESMLALGWRQRFAGWSAGLTAGFGREKINQESSQSTRLFELNLQSPVHGSQFLRMNAGYNRSASFYGPDYNYRYIKGEWIMRF